MPRAWRASAIFPAAERVCRIEYDARAAERAMRWVLAQTMRTGVTMTRHAVVPSWEDMAAR